ncbi:hypothetical protein [Ferrovibrio xuzhouensis]|uniref:Tail assembly chaperone E/41/14-like protein n=1 Tax=Ferrovibrio xuzhouensis TaxID=1576914 RepID=A0ABV7VB42_9PROT
MATLSLSKPIETPTGPVKDFTLPDEATLALFRGIEMPMTVDANTMKVEFALKTDAVTIFIANLLAIPPSFAWKLPLTQTTEVMKAALPLLPQELRDFAAAGKKTPAT